MFDWLINPKYLVLANWVVAFGSMAAAGVALWIATVGYRRDEWRCRRNDSKLGAIIVESLLEEVRTGHINMLNMQKTLCLHRYPFLMPTASWGDMNTIPDNVLLRVITTADKIEPRGFPPSQIRIHCKNYFVNMCPTVNNLNMVPNPAGLQQLLSPGEGNGDYIGAAQHVIDMLEQTKELLEENAKRRFPK